MTDPKREWRDEQGFSLTESAGEPLRFRLATTRQAMGLYFTEQEARFLLRVLPEALGFSPVDRYNDLQSQCDETWRSLTEEERRSFGASAIDRSIVEAAERYAEMFQSDTYTVRDCEEQARKLVAAVEAKRAATSSPPAEHSARPPEP